MEETNTTNISDHDVLIELRTEVRGMRDDIKKGADDTKERLILLGANKVEKEEFHQWQISHATENALKEEAMRKLVSDIAAAATNGIQDNAKQTLQNSADIAKLKNTMTYVAGVVATVALIFSVIGPLITSALGKLFHIGN